MISPHSQMSGHFKHFLITRFNLAMAGWGNYRNSGSFGSAQWMEHRFGLFDRYCFPSIRHQANTEFTWLLLMDRKTCGAHRQRMEDYKKSFKNIELIFTGEDTCLADLKNRLEENAAYEYVITTRIDNDDAYRKDAIDAIQAHFACQEFEFLNFPKGYQYSVKQRRLYLKEDLSSPFMTLIEKKKGGFVTVASEPHQSIRNSWPVRQIEGGRYWLQVIHDRNVANALCGGLRGRLRYFFLSMARPSAWRQKDPREKQILEDFNIIESP